MTTWANHLASQSRDWIAYATIAGVGDAAGQWRFSTGIGWTLSSPSGSWRPYLAEMPRLLSTRVNIIEGGVTEAEGSLALEVLDADELVTDLLSIDAPPTTALRTEEDRTGTSIGVPVGHGLTSGQVIWVGSEAMLISATTSNTVTVTRGYLGTDAAAHEALAPVYTSPPFLRHREMELRIGPLDGGDAQTQLVGRYTVDSVGYDDAHTSWRIEGRVREPHLDRICPRADDRFQVVKAQPGGLDVGDLTEVRTWGTLSLADSEDEAGEIVRLTVQQRPGIQTVAARGDAGSDIDEEIGPELKRVLTVPGGDFRSAASDTEFGSSFAPRDHVVDILLCLLTSSAVEQDGLFFANRFTSGDGFNYSTLPVGYGVGVPVALIDYASFTEVRGRLPEARLPNFVLGPKAMPFRELASEQLLKPFGLVLTSEAGLIRLKLPRIALADEVPSLQVNEDKILMSGSLPAATASREIERAISGVRLVLGRTEQQLTLSWADFGRTFDPGSLFGLEGTEVEIRALGADPAQPEALERSALARLWRSFRPPTVIEADIDASLWDWRLTELARFTMPGLVNPRTGRRGFTDVNAQLIERTEELDPDRGVWLRMRFEVQPSVQLGRIAPAADVASVSSNTATVEANRYTSTDAPSGLPTTDAGAFAVGDVVRLVDETGADAGSGTQTVTGISGNDITLDGDFSGNLAADLTLVFADADEDAAQQSDAFVYMTDAPPVWFWGEP